MSHFSLMSFPPNLRGKNLWPRERKFSLGFSTLPIFFLFPNSGKHCYTPWWGLDLVSQESTVASNSFARERSFLAYDHRCGACHNASDAQVRNNRMQCTKEKKWCEWFFLTEYSSSPVSFSLSLPSGCTGEALYAGLGASRCDWLLLLWVTLPTL